MDIEHQEQAYMKYLIDDLEEYAQSDYYPFHMPGHKRKSLSFPNPYEIDITEIDGFDNLHHATGMIKEAEVRGAELYHSKRCFFLVINKRHSRLIPFWIVTHISKEIFECLCLKSFVSVSHVALHTDFI